MKKIFLSCLLAAGLSLMSPVVAPVPGATGISVSAAESDAPGSVSVPQLTGWQQDTNGWYYLRDGEKLTGWQDIDGKRYYFKPSGYRVSGKRKIGGVFYLFRPETEAADAGALCLNMTGLIHFDSDDPDAYYYLTSDKKGVLAVSQWVKEDDAYYYANAKGKIRFGTIKVNKALYHVTKANGRMNYYGKSSEDNAFYYAGLDGVLKTGFQRIDDKIYYFNPKDGKRVSGTIKVGHYTFFLRKDGSAKTGWQKKTYYYDQYGRRVGGWYTINGKKYYFDPQKNGVCVKNGWKKIKNYYYYFNASGVLQTGFFTVGSKHYYTGSYGALKTGWQIINGRKYYINPSTFAIQTGWAKYAGKLYYLNPNLSASTYGTAVTGWVSIPAQNSSQRYWYYFNEDGTMHTGWLTQNNKRYYLNVSNGRMVTGRQTIGGKSYDFGTNGAINIDTAGSWRIEVNRHSCFVVVYRGNVEVRAFVCSTAADGVSTPTGTFTLKDKLRWHELKGPSWGQFCSHITPDILFHSVPNSQPNNHALETSEYNKLGSPASAGCIRLTVGHAKYLYDNCPIGTKVIVSDSVARPTAVPIETAQKLPLSQNYDPTDPYA